MAGLEEYLPRLLGFLKDDLAKENLTSKSEIVRLELIRKTEAIIEDSAAKKIAAKYEYPQLLDESVQRRTSVVKGNVLPVPFTRQSVEVKVNEVKVKDSNNNKTSKNTSQNQEFVLNYEELPTYEMPLGGIYEEVALLKPPEQEASVPASVPPTQCTYEDASTFGFAAERIPETSNSDSGTDYEEYIVDDEVCNNLQDSSDVSGKSKKNNKIDRSSLKFSGTLYQKGSFNQSRRRFCGIRGGLFLSCKGERSLKVILELPLTEYEVIHQEKRDGKSSCQQELRFSCPGKETHLFYTDSKHDAENWVKELRKVASSKQDSFETNSEDLKSLSDCNESQLSENSETNISGGSVDRNILAKILSQVHQIPDDARKKSKLQTLLGTVGKKLGNKTKNLLQVATELGSPQQLDGKPDTGYLSIRSEEYTGDRWFKRFCRIESGHLNCYKDHLTESHPEFSLNLRGAQLKPDGDKGQLKIAIVQNKTEHCLRMDDFMDHGRWLMSLIRETGYARQLIETSKTTNTKDSKDHFLHPNETGSIYEELRQFYPLDDVTVDESCLDDDDDDPPPPLPLYSPPASPYSSETTLDEKRKETEDGDTTYLEPKEWLRDVDEILKKKKTKKSENFPKISPEDDSNVYINRDFLHPGRTAEGKRKDARNDKSPITTSNSFPNLVSIGITDIEIDAGSKQTKNSQAMRKDDVTSGRRNQNFRPCSALIESHEHSSSSADRKTSRAETGYTNKLSYCSSDNTKEHHTDSSNQETRRTDCKVKISQSYRDIIGFDMNKINRSKRTDSISSDDLPSASAAAAARSSSLDHCSATAAANKKMVQDLVKMFEKKT